MNKRLLDVFSDVLKTGGTDVLRDSLKFRAYVKDVNEGRILEIDRYLQMCDSRFLSFFYESRHDPVGDAIDLAAKQAVEYLVNEAFFNEQKAKELTDTLADALRLFNGLPSLEETRRMQEEAKRQEVKRRQEEKERKEREAAEEQKRKAEEEQRRKAAEEQKRKEEQQRKAAEEQKRKEEQQKKVAEEQKRRAEEEQRRKEKEKEEEKRWWKAEKIYCGFLIWLIAIVSVLELAGVTVIYAIRRIANFPGYSLKIFKIDWLFPISLTGIETARSQIIGNTVFCGICILLVIFSTRSLFKNNDVSIRLGIGCFLAALAWINEYEYVPKAMIYTDFGFYKVLLKLANYNGAKIISAARTIGYTMMIMSVAVIILGKRYLKSVR